MELVLVFYQTIGAQQEINIVYLQFVSIGLQPLQLTRILKFYS